MTGAGILAQRDGIGDHHFVEFRLLDAGDGAARQHRVRGVGNHPLGAMLLERVGRLAQGTGGIDDVVHDHATAALDVADDVHHLGNIGPRPALVDDGQVGFQQLGGGTCAQHAADVGRNHHQVIMALSPDIAQ